MKSPILALPLLFELAVIVGLCTQDPQNAVPPPLPSARTAEIRELRRQSKQIQARLAHLEGESEVVLPRGIGSNEVR
jgi:hypothetical protein